ncbi:MAG TPA: hypothetical protein VHR66_06430 [Gemmataceae bacterium]|jgi:hypothetical protein|nr:hypothetical protein [Gemmataceae bacterium]
MRNVLVVAAALAIIPIVGCGPMGSGPMPPRLQADEQKKIDDAWENALAPVDHLDRQAVLDTLIVSQAFQAGVDRMEFHSEKKFSGGLVVMEIHFDRAKPNDDRFEITIRDAAGKELRHLVYNRTEVETTYQELSDPKYAKQPPPNVPVDAKKREEVQKRIEAVEKLFPKPEEPKPAK